MTRTARFMLVAAVMAASGPAGAATLFAVACEDGSQRQTLKEATGQREQMMGHGAVAFWCPAAKAYQTHRVGLEGEALDTLKAIAAMPAGDEVLVGTKVEWPDADTAKGEATRSAIGWNREKTFGQLRQLLAQLAQPTGEFVGDTGFRYYRVGKCDVPAVPVRYYLKTKTAFPGCTGGALVQEGADQNFWGE